jgi:hypothetical protein
MKLLPLSFALILILLGLSINSVSHAEIPKALPDPSLSNPVLSHDKPQPAHQQNQGNADQRDARNSPMFAEITPTQKTQEEAAEAKKERERKAATEYRTEITTWVVATATLIQAIALIWTIIVMRQTAQRQLRAYLHVTAPDLLVTQNNDCIQITLSVKNTGATPAFGLTHWLNVECNTDKLRTSFPPRPFDTTPLYLPPSVDIHLATNWHTMWRTDLLFNRGDDIHEYVYVWGEIRYTDAFYIGRYVKFRIIINSEGNSLEYCQEGNEAN